MADIDQIIAGGAGASSRATIPDFSGILDAFYKGRDQAYQQQGRNLFQGGVPTTADGQPDFAAMGKALFQHGDVGQGVALSNLDLQRNQLKLGQQAAAAMGGAEGGQGTPQPIVGPSTSRNSVTIDPSKRAGATTPQQPAGGSPQGDQPGSIVGLVSSAGIPDELAGPVIQQVSAMTRTDPNATLNPDVAQRVKQVVQAAVQRMRAGQGAPQPASPVPPQGQPAPSPQEVAPVNQNQGTFGAPSAVATRGAIPTGTDPEIQKQIAYYTYISSNPAFPKSVQEAALTRLKALQDQGAPTGPMKEYDLYRRQGGTESFQDFSAENEAKKTAATEDAKLSAQKYQSLIDNGTKAQQEIPQLQMLQTQMDDPNFFSGSGEKYNLLYKRLKSAVGINPDAAVPQEMLRKVTAANVLGSLGALKGMGQIRVAEIKMAQTASAAPDNSVPANKLLVEMALRTHQRNADIAEMAQNYKEQNGVLDAGFDKMVTQYGKTHPLFSDAEIKDWHNAIKKVVIDGSSAPTAPSGGTPKFNSPSDVHAAVASGKLKKGDTFTDPNGVQRIVP
jgi:hypothetical protein